MEIKERNFYIHLRLVGLDGLGMEFTAC